MRLADPVTVTPSLLRGWSLPEPEEGGTKHARGTVLVVGGAASTPGAVLLAGLGTLRAGAGRLQLLTVEATAVGLAVALPEAAVVGVPADEQGSVSPEAADTVVQKAERAGALVVGPGLLSKDAARSLLEAVVPQLGDVAVLVDAVALAGIGGHEDVLAPLAGRLVMTPNRGELAALLDGEEREGLDAAGAVAERYAAVVAVQEGVVAPDGRVWVSGAGGPGLGTSGSGDVLAGLVGGLLARGAPPEQAAVWGQHLHAAAGDRLASRIGRVGFLARELLDEVPPVLELCRG